MLATPAPLGLIPLRSFHDMTGAAIDYLFDRILALAALRGVERIEADRSDLRCRAWTSSTFHVGERNGRRAMNAAAAKPADRLARRGMAQHVPTPVAVTAHHA
jgi:hypothetical protein